MIALVDGDIVGYRTAAASEDTDEATCLLRVDKQMRDILYLTSATEYEVYLTGSGNFRKEIYPEYKANRKDKPKPIHLQACRDFLCKEWNAVVSEGCEADDLLGCRQTNNTVICSIDKDLLQIPGSHYNFVKNEPYEQTYLEGIRFFYHQLLKGDRADNIPGCEGIGEVKARRLLEGCETEVEMYESVLLQYKEKKDLMWTYGKCLWIWRQQGDIWNPQKLEQNWTGESDLLLGMEQTFDSTMQNVEETNQYMEPTTHETNGFPALGT